MSRHAWLLVVAAAVAGLAAGIAVNLWQREPAAPQPPAAAPPTADVTGVRRPDFALPNLAGEQRTIAGFDGQVVLLNFWASWCAPCLEEVPALVAAQDALGERGLQVVGVALDDGAPVRQFADAHGINYPVLVGAREGFDIARAYGNTRGVLPYTVIVDRQGIIRETHLGALTREDIEVIVTPFL